jgi:hypothetical protein
MKKNLFLSAGMAGLLAAFLLFMPGQGRAGVAVNVEIPLPRLFLPLPPPLVVIPGTYAYYPPGVEADIFFYHGYWYRPYRDRWFLSSDYNGPWRATDRAPRVLRGLPPTYRQHPSSHEHMPYGTVRQNWRSWEKDRYWDRKHDQRRDPRDDRGRSDRGHGRGEERGHGRD